MNMHEGAGASEGQRAGMTTKRRAILDGALVVFARDGYTRASVDVIAETAKVSSRTIYNHFGDKAGLFAFVVEDSAQAVASAHIEQIDELLSGVNSEEQLESALVACGLALHTVVPSRAPHWGLVRHIHADADHIPAAVIESWLRLGPARTKRQLALHFGELARRGLLRLDDPELAATHYSALTDTATTSALEPHPSEQRTRQLMTAAVRAFRRGYGT